MRLLDLVLGGNGNWNAADPDEALLAIDDIWLEAQVVSLLSVPGADVAAVLLDLRSAMQIDTGGAGLLVARGRVTAAIEGASGTGTLPTVLPVVSSAISDVGGRKSALLETFPSGALSLSGSRLEGYVCDVPGMPDVPPDMTEPGWSWMSSAIPQWNSECEVLAFSVR
ncbi:hypothetical protein ACFQBY_01660 [Promicromonospora citrea]|uniref:Uncharacterized protein n=1 Tax=Promicromonospora citrea TaxID=43677 RepID=A0A8H9GG25_9MICO|nr:hypothetical protein [Promicromonospora citrea]NNH51791.1 hypothetical protein [Promicromonospora citrea]GGM20744.1 hypothetical protein GCM10010102_15510 [Promicromonospora citrea]